MTTWQIIKLIPLILEAVRWIKESKKYTAYDLKDLASELLSQNNKKARKLSKDDVETIINFSLLIIKLSGK